MNAARAAYNAALIAQPLLTLFSTTPEEWIGEAELIEAWRAAGRRDAPRVPTPGPAGTDHMPTPDRGVVAWARLYRARRQWADLRDRIPPTVLASLSNDPGPVPDGYDNPRLAPCPKGGHMAWFDIDQEMSDTHDGAEDEATYDLFNGDLRCRLCGLEMQQLEFEKIGLGGPIGARLQCADGSVTDTYF